MCNVVRDVNRARLPLHLFPRVARKRSNNDMLTATTSLDSSKLDRKKAQREVRSDSRGCDHFFHRVSHLLVYDVVTPLTNLLSP